MRNGSFEKARRYYIMALLTMAVLTMALLTMATLTLAPSRGSSAALLALLTVALLIWLYYLLLQESFYNRMAGFVLLLAATVQMATVP